MKKFFVFIGVLIHWLWKLLTTGSTLLVNVFFLFSLLFIFLLFAPPGIDVPDKAALVIAPAGTIVEQPTVINPISRIVNEFAGMSLPEETLLQDILDTIDAAATDERIELIVLSLDRMERCGLNQLQVIGRYLETFRGVGKKVIAVDDSYDQGHYYLASFADEIILNPMGGVHLRGFGLFRLYMKEMFDKLAVNFHVFRVGTYKSAVEPFIRTGMSDEARAANQVWLNKAWDLFRADIAAGRKLDAEQINTYVNDMPDLLRKAGGSTSRMALEAGLVDAVKTRPELNDYLTGLVGASGDGSSFSQIHFQDYLRTLTPSFTSPENSPNHVGIIIARGDIVQGEELPEQISSRTLIHHIRQARDDDSVKALVLRIDSGGGSALASEQIRQELLRFQETGKPLVVSMGTLAASGAYWLSADADLIVASPYTLTGSIGIFGILPTFERSLAKIGVANDGTGTTKLAGTGDPTRPLPPELQAILQLTVEEGYNRFLAIVEKGRALPAEQVRAVAQGRVWDGVNALELGLVDELGTLDDAIGAAAVLAGLTDFTAVYIPQPGVSGRQLLRDMGMTASALLRRDGLAQLNPLSFLRPVSGQFSFLSRAGDQADIYAHCLIPHSAIAF